MKNVIRREYMESLDNVDFSRRIEKYSNALSHGDIGGYHHLPKEFVRIDDNTNTRNKRIHNSYVPIKKTAKDSLFFRDLFRSLMSNENHYITYLNDSFKCKKSEIVIPDHVSCLLKSYMDIGGERCYFECVGSRLANALGIDTVYNIAIASTHDEYDNTPQYDTLISVDYVPYGYRTESMVDLGIDFNEDTYLVQIMQELDDKLPQIAQKEKLNLTLEKANRLKEQFALQFLFRTLICEDYDFVSKNVSILMGEDGDFRLGPAYDMELLCDGAKSQGYYNDMAEASLTYMMNNMPKTLEKFMRRLEEKYNSHELESIIMNTLDISTGIKNYVKKSVMRNCCRLKDIYMQMQSSLEK